MEPEWTIISLLKWTESYFNSHGIDSPRMTAEILLAHTLKTTRINLYIQHDKPLSCSELIQFKTLIQRRINREPVAYITGSKEFWSLDFTVTRDVLIPRPDTECIVEATLALLPNQHSDQPKKILDLGTGSGAIIIALASERPHNVYFATDRSSAAAILARKNAAKHGLSDTIHFLCSNWFDAINPNKHSFDIIVSNPPYIPTDIIPTLAPEINRYEPRIALDGDHDGLSDIRKILHSAPDYLLNGGYLLLEIGFDQMNSVFKIAGNSSFYNCIEFIKDYAGHHRVLKLKKN
ncbi:MAG: peptide chain release factor N(5)-glutamine methyltransferase [Desulfobacterium sp.]|nr:peptide chain release factor N(5)-glutamine methyltransferase [Desulfobacterium sp.]